MQSGQCDFLSVCAWWENIDFNMIAGNRIISMFMVFTVFATKSVKIKHILIYLLGKSMRGLQKYTGHGSIQAECMQYKQFTLCLKNELMKTQTNKQTNKRTNKFKLI